MCSRHFNHRCKGITMATFKPEEMRAIEEGGNAVRPQRFRSSCAQGLGCCAQCCRGVGRLHHAERLLSYTDLTCLLQVALAKYLAKWSSSDLSKPTDRCAALPCSTSDLPSIRHNQALQG